MNTKEIQQIVGKAMILRGHNPVIENLSFLLFGEVDVFSINSSGYTNDFEVKISRSDFKADKVKAKFKNINLLLSKTPFPTRTITKIPNYFSYVCPEGLIKLSDLEKYMGLYHIVDNELQEIRKPQLIHNNKIDRDKVNKKCSEVYSQRKFLDGNCLLTYNNKQITSKNKNYGI